MPQETAKASEPPGAPAEPPDGKLANRGERLGRALRRVMARVRSSLRAVPVGRVAAVRAHWRKALLIAVVLGVALPPWLARRGAADDRVHNGVRSGRVVLSGQLRPELTETIARRARELEGRPLWVVIAGKRFAVEPRALGFRVDVEKTVERALGVGRGRPFFVEWFGYYERGVSPLDVGVAALHDLAKSRTELEARAAAAIADPPFSGGIRLDGASAAPLPPRGGHVVAKGAEAELLAPLSASDARDTLVPLAWLPAKLPANAADQAAADASALLQAELVLRSSEPTSELRLGAAEIGPLLRTEPDGARLRLTFDAEKLTLLLAPLRRKLEREPVDAKFEVDAHGAITILPSEPGLRVDQERFGAALLAAAKSPARSAELPLLREPLPALSSERAAGLGIKGLVSSFTTRHPCCERRVENIHRIADILNGRVIEPGQTVSVNELVGPRTLKAGFVPAPTIEEGEMVDSIGGGISQFATTLFNALFHGGYDIVERQPHTYWFPRYPMGHEATLSWPKPDIIFRNDTAAGLLIKTSYTDTNITVRLFGDNGGRKVRAEVSGRQNVLPAPVEILPNPAVPSDEEKIKEPGSIGWSVIVSRILSFADGTKKEERRRVTYKPRPKRVEVHPCRIPSGEKGYTGEPCPEPEDVEELEGTEASAGTEAQR
jgi:vancomycin resistance protein YoaR